MNYSKEESWVKVYGNYGIVVASITAILAAVGNPEFFIDVVLILLLSFFIYKRKLWAGVGLLLLNIIDKIIQHNFILSDSIAFFISIIVISICIRGTVALYRLKHATFEIKAEVDNEK